MFEILMASGKKSFPDNVQFMGEVATGNLINGAQLAIALGLTAGTAQNDYEPWLSWVIDGKNVLYSKKTYRHTVSRNQLNARGIINDTQKIVLRGKEYWIGLPFGLNPNSTITSQQSSDHETTHKSEWNRLLYPIVTGTNKYSQVGPNQANYSPAELNLGPVFSSGVSSFCRELSTNQTNPVVVRGGAGVAHQNGGNPGDTAGGNGWRPRLELIGDALPAGTFLGEVPVSELITGDALAASIGLQVGISQFSDSPWLKWEIDGKIVYYSKLPYRKNLSWDSLSAAGAVNDTRTINIQGRQYFIGLPKGSNPAAGVVFASGVDTISGHNSEWNRLMYPIANDTWKYSQSGPNQANYSPDQLGFRSGEVGDRSICREVATDSSTNRIFRGYDVTVSYLISSASSLAFNGCGWRPRLELLP